MSSAPIPDVVALDSPHAVEPALTGAKAANLADASARGLPVLPGFVVTTGATERGELDPRAIVPLAAGWRSIGGDDGATVVVRSSSTAEDTSSSSMAGQFTSVLGVRGWDGLLDAIGAVLASGARHNEVTGATRPMAVLVQPQLDAVCGGVVFGLDPVTGDRRHLVVEAVAGGPDTLVSGTASAVHCLIGRRGRLVGGRSHRQRVLLPAHRRQRLAALARRAEAVFDAPQDLEWAVDASDRLWLLQSRPVTAWGDSTVSAGPVLGPGPVAETFPDPLRPLEIELWAAPLREGVIGALGVTGAIGRRRLDSSPVVTTVGGRVAADLELFGISPQRRAAWQALNPLPAARRLLAAWRVGRLRAVLPALAAEVVATIDAELTAISDLATLDDAELLELLTGAGHGLAALHAHEVLAGMLLEGGDRTSVASIAVAALAAGRADGDLTDEELIAARPVVLALVPPAIGRPHGLPPPLPAQHGDSESGGVSELGPRDALRLRCRWVQELTVRIADQLGARLAAAGVLDRADLVADMTFDELRLAVEKGRRPVGLDARASTPTGPPLPVAFRLTPSGAPVAVRSAHHGHADGLAASAGRAFGVACHGVTDLTTDEPCVLVVDTLDPRLATALPDVAGLVSETGSALSHLAILAREMHVPAVVGVADARSRFPSGTALLVDGSTGEVRSSLEEER